MPTIDIWNDKNDDISYIVSELGDTVKVDGNEQQILINHKSVGDVEEKKIRSLERIKRGSLVEIEDFQYLQIADVNLRNGMLYEGIVRRCNAKLPTTVCENVIIGYDPMWGDPVYESTCRTEYNIPSIVDGKVFTATQNQAINLVQNEISVTIQENDMNKENYGLNKQMIILDRNYKVIAVDNTKSGLLILNCKSA
ncbi:hypothetical protein ACQKJC_24785 [Priestia koreensis]|uniref:hypothetical protein n=1 Tax=Priestia koreensis TaxID=284581 RepID=UPI003D01BF49